MTREEAIMELNQFSGTTQLKLSANFWTALNMAIKALEQKPSTDAISRQALMSAFPISDSYTLEDICKTISFMPSVTPTTCIAKVTFSKDDLQELVDKKVKELAQHMERKWIPCSERQPNENGNYLAFYRESDGTATLEFMMVDHCNAGGGWLHEESGKKSYKKVIAWMPLPEPYKVESEEQP